MQDRYAGDIGDYGKIALLRCLKEQGFRIGINWYKTDALESEKSENGAYKHNDGKYLIPKDLYKCDKELASILYDISQCDGRSVGLIEKAKLVPKAIYYSDIVSVPERKEWYKKSLRKLNKADLIFLDPDNGLLVKSVGKNSEKSVKYAFYEEVDGYLKQGKSVLIYNHRCRKAEDAYFRDICNNLHETTAIPTKDILKITFPKCSVRDYLAVPVSKEHMDRIRIAFECMEQSIWGELGVCRIPLVNRRLIKSKSLI